jgi:5-methylcytosine-specific restriction endonuclease McrA
MPRNYKKENEYKKKPEQVKFREERNKARAVMEKAGLVHKGDGKQVDHIVPLSKGGKTIRSNLRVVSASANDSFKRNSKRQLVSQTSTRERRKGK